jgi:hypothetical protein
VPVKPSELSCLEMMRVASWLRRPDARERARRWVSEHRAQLEEHAAGTPCRFGHDCRVRAQRLLDAA